MFSMSPTALVFEERRYTRRQFEALADGLAATLRGRGVTAGKRVALMASNRPEFVVALHAIWRLAAVAGLITPPGEAPEARHALGVTARERIQIATPPSHILGLRNIVTALQTGVWMRLHRRFDIDRMLQHIKPDRITVEMAVAPIALAIASHPKLESYDLSSLRYIMWGATPVSASVAATAPQ